MNTADDANARQDDMSLDDTDMDMTREDSTGFGDEGVMDSDEIK